MGGDGVIEIREDNTRELLQAMDKALAKSLEEIGLVAESYAVKACPVVTGRLSSSITHLVRTGEKAVYIGTNVEYAPYVELGTSRSKKQPFLVPAATEHEGTYAAILKKNMSS